MEVKLDFDWILYLENYKIMVLKGELKKEYKSHYTVKKFSIFCKVIVEPEKLSIYDEGNHVVLLEVDYA